MAKLRKSRPRPAQAPKCCGVPWLSATESAKGRGFGVWASKCCDVGSAEGAKTQTSSVGIGPSSVRSSGKHVRIRSRIFEKRTLRRSTEPSAVTTFWGITYLCQVCGKKKSERLASVCGEVSQTCTNTCQDIRTSCRSVSSVWQNPNCEMSSISRKESIKEKGMR